MNDNIHVILQALGEMSQAELVVVSNLAEQRTIQNDIKKLSVEKLGAGMTVGDSFYDHINSKITISTGGCEAEALCERYLGGRFLQLYRYEIQLIWDDDGFMLCINSPREDAMFDTRHSEYLQTNYALDVRGWLARLEESYQQLFAE